MVEKKPKHVSRKRWKEHLEVVEMNHRIIREKMKNKLYIPNAIDWHLLEQGMYKANRRKKK